MTGAFDNQGTPPTAAADEEEEALPELPRWLLITAAVAILLAAVVAVIALVAIPSAFQDQAAKIVIILIGGVIAVMLLLYFGTVILRSMGVASRRHALGMPEGSIRALIAVSLILLFAIIGVTVLYSSLGGEDMPSNGITAAEIDQLENVQIISISAVDPAASPGAERFNVVARAELTQAGHDFGLQLLTTVSTLVVAVAGFYFGARSVDQATKSALRIQSAASKAGGGQGLTEQEIEGDELGEDEVIEAREDDASDDDDALAKGEKPPDGKSPEPKTGEGATPAPSTEATTASAKSPEAKPPETKPADKPAETKPTEGKPAETKPAEPPPPAPGV